VARNVMEERLDAAAERTAEAEERQRPAPPTPASSRRPSPMLSRPRVSGGTLGAIAVGGLFALALAASIAGGPPAPLAPAVPTAAVMPVNTGQAPAVAPQPAQEAPAAPTPAPLPTGYIEPVNAAPAAPQPVYAPVQAAPVAPPVEAPVVISDLVPIIEAPVAPLPTPYWGPAHSTGGSWDDRSQP